MTWLKVWSRPRARYGLAVVDSASLLYTIGRVDRGVRRELRRRLEPWSLSIPEYTTLSVLARRPGLSNAQLARRALITPQAMNEVIAELERRRFVKRSPDPSHGRILRTELTKRGRTTLDEALKSTGELERLLLADVPAKDRPVVERALETIMRTLSSGD